MLQRIVARIRRALAKWLTTSDDGAVPTRFRDIVSDPINLRVARSAQAGMVSGNEVVLHNGIVVPFRGKGAYYGSFSDILVINRGVHEPLEEFVFQEMLKALPPSPTMVELGAYWGHYSMWMKSARPDASVTLVEPSNENMQAGQANFARNSLKAYAFIQASVGPGAWTVDDFLGAEAKLTVLHSDIQGAEVDMLQGAQRALERRAIDFLFVSTHSQELHEQVRKALTSCGYIIEADADVDNDTTSHDGLIFSRSPNLPPVLYGFRPLGRKSILSATPEQLVRSIAF